MINRDDLRRVELFADLDDEHLCWLAETGRVIDMADREVLFEEVLGNDK